MSRAERLPNGNTLICSGADGIRRRPCRAGMFFLQKATFYDWFDMESNKDLR